MARLHPVKDGEMREIAEEVHRNDTRQLLIHGRFLEAKVRESEW